MEDRKGKGLPPDMLMVSKAEFDLMTKELNESRKQIKQQQKQHSELIRANRELMLMGLVKQALMMLEKRMNHDADEVERLKSDLDKYQGLRPGDGDGQK